MGRGREGVKYEIAGSRLRTVRLERCLGCIGNRRCQQRRHESNIQRVCSLWGGSAGSLEDGGQSRLGSSSRIPQRW